MNKNVWENGNFLDELLNFPQKIFWKYRWDFPKFFSYIFFTFVTENSTFVTGIFIIVTTEFGNPKELNSLEVCYYKGQEILQNYEITNVFFRLLLLYRKWIYDSNDEIQYYNTSKGNKNNIYQLN